MEIIIVMWVRIYCSHWCTIIAIVALIPPLLVILYLNILADENSLPVAYRCVFLP